MSTGTVFTACNGSGAEGGGCKDVTSPTSVHQCVVSERIGHACGVGWDIYHHLTELREENMRRIAGKRLLQHALDPNEIPSQRHKNAPIGTGGGAGTTFLHVAPLPPRVGIGIAGNAGRLCGACLGYHRGSKTYFLDSIHPGHTTQVLVSFLSFIAFELYIITPSGRECGF